MTYKEEDIKLSVFYKYENEHGQKYKIIKENEPKGKSKVRQFIVKFKDSDKLMEVSITSILNGKVKNIERQKKETKRRQRQIKKTAKANKYAQKSTMSKQNAKRLLSLDISSHSTGFSVFIDGKLVDYGFIYQSKEKSVTVRLNNIKHKILELIDKHQITGVVIEDVLQLHKIALYVLSKVQGIVLDNLYELDIDVAIIPVADWKAKIGLSNHKNIKGKNDRETSKLRTVARVKELFDIDLTKFSTPSDLSESADFDICDSVALGWVLLKYNLK